ncbi:MAG: hypothetical protein AAGG48_25885 [Planctomycetota bacterium]
MRTFILFWTLRGCRASFCLVILVLLSVSSGKLEAQPPVTLQNGSFEEIEGEIPSGWNFSSGGGFDWSVDTDEAFVGERCARVTASGGAESRPFANLGQTFDATALQGKTVRFTAAVKTRGIESNGRGQLWFRVDGPNTGQANNILAFDNMQDRPIKSDQWEYYEITSKIPDNAKVLILGLLVFPKCEVFIDDVSLETIDDVEDTDTTAYAFQSGGASNARVAQTGPPLINHWLWLVVVSLVLFSIGQSGWLGGNSAADELTQETQHRFAWIRKFAIRFSVIYWLLYCLPSPFSGLLFGWETPVVTWYTNAMTAVDRWTADNVLGIAREFPPPRGSGDTTKDFVHLLVCFAFAMFVGLIWAVLVSRRPLKNDLRVNGLLRSYLRYVLAFTMLGYGLAKVGMVTNQFPEPNIDQLYRTWGQSPPQNVVWSFMGTSRPYTIFAGLGEVVGCLLLIWRRTATLGAMVTFGVMLNVVMMNFCYDIPVKQYSFHLMVMALCIVLPDAIRLGNVLVWNRPTTAVTLRPTYRYPSLIWIHRAAKTWLIVVGVGLPIYTKIRLEMNPPESLLGEPAWFGDYEVDGFYRNDELVEPYSDRERWKTLSLSRSAWNPKGGRGPVDYLLVNKTLGRTGGQVTVNLRGDTIRCESISPGNIKLKFEGDDLVELEYGFQEIVRVKVHRLRRENFPIYNQNFRWIRE